MKFPKFSYTARAVAVLVLAAASLPMFGEERGRTKDIPLSIASVRRAAGVPEPKVTLCALKTYDENWTGTDQAGIYTIEAKENGEVKLVKSLNLAADVVAAVKSGGSMHCISTENNGTNAYYFTLNTDKWNMTGSKSEISVYDVPSDLTVDPNTGKVYGAVYYEDPETYDYGFIGFGEFSLSTHTFNIRKVLERDIYALAADNNGRVHLMFGTRTGWIEPATLNWDTGLTGVHNTYYPEGHNTMTWDESTGLLYAIVSEEQMKAGQKSWHTYLVKIDPVSFEYTTIFEFPSHQTYAGLYVMPSSVDKEAPKGVTGVSVNFTSITSTEGTVSFTAPSETVAGNPLTSNISVIIQIGDTEHVIPDVAPGATVTSPAYTFPYGKQKVKITTANSVDRGESVETEIFAGEDVPCAVTGLILDIDGEHPLISWEAPASGLNGGKIDPAALMYKVVRQPGNVVLATDLRATRFEDSAYVPALEAISYTVTPRSSAGDGESASTAKAVLGGEWTVPHTEQFDSQDDYDLWTVVNSNGGSTWQYSSSDKTVQYKYDDPDRLPGDDWIISPSIKFEAGKSYTLSYDYRGLYNGMKESFEVMLGSSIKPTDLTTCLASHNDVGTGKKRNSLVFTVPADGKYRLGFHATSPAYQYILEIDNIAIDLLQGGAPAAATDMSVTPAPRGALSASVRLSLPGNDIDGKPLSSNLSVSVSRTGASAPVYIADGLTPGAVVSFDDAVETSGIYDYTATVSNLVGTGPETAASAYIGIDVPDAVQNLSISENADGKPVLNWTAPVIGRNGGWFDDSSLTYNVYRYFDDLDLIADRVTDLTATDSELDISGEQKFVSYVVVPYAGEDAGRAIESPYMLTGAPYAAPLTEGFAKADMTWYPWVSVTDKPLRQAWTLDAKGEQHGCSDYDNNSGLATFHSAGETEKGVGSWFESPKIDIRQLSSPQLRFALYLSESPAGSESVQPMLNMAGSDYSPLCQPIARTSGSGWKLFSVAIPAEALSAPWIRIAFKGVTDGAADIYLDAVSIADRPGDPVIIKKIAGASKVAVDNPTTFDIYLVNSDSEPSQAGELTLSCGDGPEVSFAVESLAPGELKMIETEYTFTSKGSYSLTAKFGAASATHAVTCVDPVFPHVTNLAATRDEGAVLLNWEAPSPRGAATDSFEQYESWAIEGIGDWTMHDQDLDLTYRINAKELLPQAPDDYPNSTAPKAWQVCDANELCINEWPEGTPHSGDKMLMAMANMNYVNDDWAVSPRLNGEAQHISLYAKAFTSSGTAPERLQVLCSTTDDALSSFTALHSADYLSITDEWTLLEFDLPEGAKYFALRCVSDGAFALFVDDVSFYDTTVPALRLDHYEVLRDGVLLTTVTEPEYRDNTAPLTACTYAVKAVYDKGTSDSVTATATDLSAVQSLFTDSEDSKDLDIYTLSGIKIGNTSDMTNLPKGIYLTRKGKLIK